ncbi:hypothetical protein E1B28_010561 [Marasmius oreades]|uniref:Uncharacterized protein n=1 Tax=Marasmius oreades TaxID=181124 RepID=A0A9P7UR93_9AGAR|nr:uncharacterized protein E1B28_010561 [Marasmius oreades]KAG7091532.1 hypothetical protein E1B28_010561 [Marasmius oreades]
MTIFNMRFPAPLVLFAGFLAATLAGAQGTDDPRDPDLILYQLAEGTNMEFFERTWVTGCVNYDLSRFNIVKKIRTQPGDWEGNNTSTEVRTVCILEDADGNTLNVTEELAERWGATRIE